MITLEINGTEFTGFKSVNVSRSITTFSSVFDVVAAPQEDTATVAKAGDPCRIFVDGVLAVTGFIDRVSPKYKIDTHDIVIQGRDRTADLIDSTLKMLETSCSSSMQVIIQLCLDALGITDIKIISNVSDTGFATGDVQSITPGEGVFEFILRLAKKRQVLLRTDGDGNILIFRPDETKIVADVVNSKNDEASNVISGNMSYDFSNRFHKYTVSAQGNNASSVLANSTVDLGTDSNIEGVALDEDKNGTPLVRTSRQLYIQAEQTYTTDDCQKRAEWEANMRRIQSEAYGVTMAGHSITDGVLWTPGQLVRVRDEFADIVDVTMMIDSVEYSFNQDTGSRSNLVLVDKDAYKVEAQKPVVSEKSNSFGAKYKHLL